MKMNAPNFSVLDWVAIFFIIIIIIIIIIILLFHSEYKTLIII